MGIKVKVVLNEQALQAAQKLYDSGYSIDEIFNIINLDIKLN